MRALSLIQPWASGIALGFKEWETRSWPTKYRGEVAIHASKRFPKEAMELLRARPFLKVLDPFNPIPFGAIIAVATLADCKRVEDVAPLISNDERRWGDFSPGRRAWQMKGVILLPRPVPCAGSLGLWRVPDDVERQVREQMADANDGFGIA